MGLFLHRGAPRLALAYSTKSKSSSSPKPKSATKTKEAVAMKKLHRENKEIFGELLETKREKVKKDKILKRIEFPDEGMDVLLSRTDYGPSALGVHKKGVSTTRRASVSILDRSTNILTRAGEKNAEERTEANWALNNFPARAKVLNRSKPETPLYTFDETSTSSAKPTRQFEVFVKKRSSKSQGKDKSEMDGEGNV